MRSFFHAAALLGLVLQAGAQTTTPGSTSRSLSVSTPASPSSPATLSGSASSTVLLSTHSSLRGSNTTRTTSDRRRTSTRTTTLACVTSLGNSSLASIPTIHNTVTQSFPVSRKTVLTRTVTVTPKRAFAVRAVVATSTSTVTASTTSGTSTTTVLTVTTSTTTVKRTITTTKTATATTTVPPATVTAAPRSGFVPLASAIATAQAKIDKRAVPHKHRKNKKFQRRILANGALDTEHFPAQVVCNTLIQVITTNLKTVVAPKTRTLFASASTRTSTSVSTKIVTTTQMLVIGAAKIETEVFTNTRTMTTTRNVTSTATITRTLTRTSAGPTPTFYAACGTNNIVGSVNGTGIKEVGLVREPAVRTATDAYSCCVACQLSTNCAFSQFFPSSKTCFIARRNQRRVCDSKAEAGEFLTGFDVQPDVSFLSNSGCGQVVFEGVLTGNASFSNSSSTTSHLSAATLPTSLSTSHSGSITSSVSITALSTAVASTTPRSTTIPSLTTSRVTSTTTTSRAAVIS
ncbi:Hypothetical protein D9617_24g016380 [Elsinoe fawcettii]|nr:Hypothetical protein D9617_24g016380 [Elsinoe fawcettii]